MSFANIRSYWPLIVVVTLAVLMPLAIDGTFLWMRWMHQAMGFFLILLAMLKLFNLRGFQTGFQKYDVVTQIWPAYGLLYPFLELALGFSYLMQNHLIGTAWATIMLMGTGLIGIVRSRLRGQMLNCACMGNILQVPLSTVSLLENGGMIAMAVFMLCYHTL